MQFLSTVWIEIAKNSDYSFRISRVFRRARGLKSLRSTLNSQILYVATRKGRVTFVFAHEKKHLPYGKCLIYIIMYDIIHFRQMKSVSEDGLPIPL